MVGYLFRKARAGVIYASRGPEGLKRMHELRVWKARFGAPGWEGSDRYMYQYTDFFGLDEAFYSGKKVLDIGCGPWGSLEWADMTSLRVGLDPFADTYRRAFSTSAHKMQYVSARAEQIPFPDNYFDVVGSFMSLKHVIGIESAVEEIIRVTARGGIFLLHTPINRPANTREPTTITWDIIEKFCQYMEYSRGFYVPQKALKARDFQQWLPLDPPNEPAGRLILKAMFTKA